MEADNLCCFFREELTALELSLRLPESMFTSQYSLDILMMNWFRSALFYDIATEALEFPPTPDTVVKSVCDFDSAHEPCRTGLTLCYRSFGGSSQAHAEDEPALPEEEDSADVELALPEEEDSAEVEPEQAALADILEGDIAGAEIEEDQDLVANVCAQVVWDSPEVRQSSDFRAERYIISCVSDSVTK
jgi:hypothetical protein